MSATTDPYQAGLASMSRLAAEAPADRNEDTTRLQLIDALLIDCLQHRRAEITTEEHVHPGYADYIVSVPSRALVIEAKRESRSFSLPLGLEGRVTVSLATLMEDEQAGVAIRQVMDYAQRAGIPLAAIANGHQLAVFLGARIDGKGSFEGEALLFLSLEDMLTNFRRLWDLFGREALIQSKALQVLRMSNSHPPPPPKLSQQIANYPGFRARTAREVDLKILSTVFIQDIEGNAAVTDEFLRECYYNSGSLSQYAAVSKEILRNRYGALPDALGIPTESVRTNKGISPALKKDLITAAASSKPIVLLGDVGVGKTMFIRHLLRVEAATELSNSLVFYVDFASRPALQSDLENYIVDALREQLEADHGIDPFENGIVRAIYNPEVNRFRRGIYGALRDTDRPGYERHEIEMLGNLTANIPKHIERILKHLDGSAGRKSVVVLDNIDQRPREFQDQVFVISQALSASLQASVFVSLRPSTFYDSKLRGALAAYQPRAFVVSPPRVSEVIAKRLSFARKQLEDTDFAATELSIDAADLVAYLDSLELGFTKDHALMELLENLSGGNIRLALEFLAAFIGSGYVDTERVLRVAAEGGVYTIPVHEFVRAIVLGENDLYDPTTSRVVNVFDISIADEREHFLLPLLLSFVQTGGAGGSDEGYVGSEAAYAEAQKWGFLPEQISWHLERAVAHGLLDAAPGNALAGPFRITTIGAYMYKEMVALFSYVDAVLVDTPVLDPSTRSAIHDVRSIDDRLERARTFKAYLDDVWADFASVDGLSFDWVVYGSRLDLDLELAQEKADRAKKRRAAQG